jgi:septation ring formation regulator EzrA
MTEALPTTTTETITEALDAAMVELNQACANLEQITEHLDAIQQRLHLLKKAQGRRT